MKGRAIAYSAAELRFIESHRTMKRSELHAAFVARFGRADVTRVHLNALCKRRGWLTGRTGYFPKGNTPFNKGKPHPARGRAAETQFKKGERRGVAVALWKPIGTERLSKNGYLERKVNNDWPLQKRWRGVHLLNWEALNGPLPKGHALKCLDGDKRNVDPANWICIPRALLPRLNGRHRLAYDTAPAELKPALLAIAKVEHAAAQRDGLTPTQRMIKRRRERVA